MKIAKDKQLHFIGGAIIAVVASFFVYYIDQPYYAEFGLFAACFAGAVKEIRDKQGYGTPEVMDFVATALGGLLVYIFIKGYS